MIKSTRRLSGGVEQDIQLRGAVRRDTKLSGHLLLPVGYPIYDGAYVVTPKVTEQELPTQDKRMADNVRVLEIPCYEVSNAAKGVTIIIGGES